MKIPFFPPIGPGDFSTIVNLALYELGLTEAFLLRAFTSAGGKPKFSPSGEWDMAHLDYIDHIWISNLLLLSLDCISIGYCRWAHKKRVGDAILEGAYVLPRNPQLTRFFNEYLYGLRQNRIFEKEHMGASLRYRSKLKRREESKSRRLIKIANRKLCGEKRQFFEKMHQDCIRPSEGGFTDITKGSSRRLSRRIVRPKLLEKIQREQAEGQHEANKFLPAQKPSESGELISLDRK